MYENGNIREFADTESFVNQKQLKRLRDRRKDDIPCSWVAKFAVVIIIFFSLGAAAGYYGPDFLKHHDVFDAMGRSKKFVTEFNMEHAELSIDDFHEQLCLNHSDTKWQVQGNIVGGSNAVISDHPWQVSIQEYYTGQNNPGYYAHFCGGAIIAPQFILSAAHCFEGSKKNPDNWYKISVLAGSTTTNIRAADLATLYGAQATRINTIETHPKWDPTNFHYDFALVMTRKLLHYKHGEHATRPICMPKIGSDIEILKRVRDRGSLTCKLSGWGVTDPTGTMPSPVLKEVALPWIDNEECNKLWDMNDSTRFINIERFMLCFGQVEGGIDACMGDSGGSISCLVDGIPLSMGVVSWGIGCAEANRPGAYARTSYAADWVTETMKLLHSLEDTYGYSVPEHWRMRYRCIKKTTKPLDKCELVLPS